MITEGLAVPFADELGGGVTLAGFIMAAPPLGNVVGLFFFGRLVFNRQQRLVTPLAISGVLAVIAAALLSMLPGRAVFTVAALVAAGACLSYLSAIQSEISVLVAPERTRSSLRACERRAPDRSRPRDRACRPGRIFDSRGAGAHCDVRGRAGGTGRRGESNAACGPGGRRYSPKS